MGGADRPHLEPLPRPRLPTRPGAVHVAIPPAAHQRAKRDPPPGQPRTLRRVRAGSRRSELGRRPAAGEPAALGRAARRGLRGRRPPRPHLAQRLRPGSLGIRPLEPRPDRLARGRREPDPRPPSSRRDCGAARARAPRRPLAGAAGDGFHADRARRRRAPSASRISTRAPARAAAHSPSSRSREPPSTPTAGPASRR